MNKLFTTAAVAASLLVPATATPLAPRDEIKSSGPDFVGFDEQHIKVYLAGETPLIPEIKTLTAEDLANADESTVEPFVIEDSAEKRWINGNDERYQFTSRDYPFVAAGKVFYDNGVICSGALVGPRHVLTAAHCLQGNVPGYFSPGWDNGDPLGTGRITTVISIGDRGDGACGVKNDWAVLIIDQRKGDEFGYFGVKNPDAGKKGQRILTHIGYPGDKYNGNRPYRQDGIWAKPDMEWDCDATGPVYTDQDLIGGQSGGPVWENDGGPYIWGVAAVTYIYPDSYEQTRYAWAGLGSGNQMVGAVNSARRDFP